MEDADLFMECEEEELEPWQQLNQNQLDESSGTAGSKTSTGAVAVENPALSKPVVISSLPPASNNMSTVPLLTNTLPTTAPAGISKSAPGQQLILAQGAGGLTPVALSQVILPGSSAATSQPIYLTTQGIPVQNIQSGQSPMSIVLNVQQGQAVRPITLVQAPGTPGIFKPAVRTAQIITQQAPMRPATPVVNRAQAPGSFTAVQIPATLTIRTTTPASQPRAKTVPPAPGPQPSTSPRAIPINTQTKIVTVKAGEGNLDVQNLMSFMNSVSLPAMGQPQTFVVMSNQKTNGAGSAAVHTAAPSAHNSIVQVTSAAPSSHTCPRCGAKFKMIEALRGHMCFCCPDMPRTTNTDAPATKPQIIQTKSLSMPVKMERMDLSLSEPQSRIVMLVDDFYYGTYEGNRVYVPSDNLKEPISFKCLTCGKKLKNNIRLMNHMKFHVDVEQQTGEVASHTSCPHCFRQFPTPFRLQCHVESVHNALESTTRCKICEWAFDSEPVFLQHMKNTHKPGEMPYVCQVCQYRSSFYSDVHNHFRTWHEDTRYLLCIYCLKVFKHSSTYQQHFSRHQNATVYNCNKCRLQFLFTKEKVEHKVNHHKTFRKPSQLEGLQAGTKVTIRAYAAQKKMAGQMSSKPSREPTNTERDIRTAQFGQTSSAHTLNTKLLSPQSTTAGKKQVSKMYDYLVKFQEHRALLGRQKCVECTFDIPDFANHYPTYVHCSLCAYSTCCSRAYANHMINNHVPGRTQRGRSKKGSLSWLNLTCACCNYKTNQGDLMAKHLVQYPDHYYCVFFMKECLETDIEFCQVEEEEEEEEEQVEVVEPQEEGASDDAKPDWLSMENWRVPGDGGSVPEFTDICGPQHFMGKSSDVLEYFQLLFPDTLIDQIVYETNTYAKCQRSLGRGDPTWNPLSNEEVKGFIGLCILMGVQCLPELEMYWSWKHYHSCTTFYRTMSVTRFKQIRAHIRMSSMLAEEDNRPMDKMSFFQSMLKILETSMQEAYKPNKCLTVDQALLPAQDKGDDREKCTNSLPRIWLLCDSKSGYCHKLLILTQQEKHTDLGSLVVPYLVEGLEGKNHQIFISNKLTSVPLMIKLHKKSVYCSSSIPTHSPVLPAEFWSRSALESPGAFIQVEHPPVLFTRWKDAKEMICLSTNAAAGQPDTVWRKSTSKAGELSTISRPLAFKLLQDNMRGVDICNQLLACNQLGGLVLDTNWRRLFWFLVNLSIINSFIILRETRKGNPPGWLQGGHFSQADYRKRLGYQLAKCAEREALLKKIANDRMQQRRYEGRSEVSETFEGVRHRLAKITFKTRRCKSCNLKNQRHESVYGCTACHVNLCKGTRCFWDYHGFSAKFKGNPKIGFVEPKRECTQPALDSKNVPRSSSVDESATSLEVSSVQDEDLDQELAPLEESDSDFETDDSSQQEPLTIEDEQTVSETTAKPGSPKTNKEREETLSVRQLRILLFALCSGVEKAAKDMDTRPQLIRAWLRDKEKRLDREGRSGEAVERLVEWVLVQREQQSIINEKNLFQKASEVHSQTNQSSSFRISYEWAVCFMLQHKLGLQSLALPTCQLPRGLEENCHHFTGFVQRQIQMHNVPRSAVGAMDELSIFVDFDTLVDGSITSKEAAFQLEGTGKPWVNIYLALLADGAMLPTVLFFKGTPFGSFSKRLPDSLLLEARVEGFSENEELDIWNARVWQQHLNSQKGSKTILVMDGHHSHMSEGFVSTMSGTKTLPVIIPSGCTSKLQPLEICVRPVLKKFLLARWSQLTTQGCVAEVTPEELVRLLVTWLEEFLACCSSKPELTQYSFCLSRVIAEQEECIKEANTQVALINTLTEAMLGPEAVDSEPLSEEESVETLAEGAMETSKNVTGEESPGTAKEDVQQTGTKRDSQTRDEGRTETEVSENEQQAQKMVNKGLEASSETSETCSSLLPHVFPQSPASTQVSEKEDLLGPSEACQDSGVTQTDAGFSS